MLLTVDPGGTTGFAWVNDAEDELVPIAEQLPPQQFLVWADMLADLWGEDLTIVVERFTITNRTLKVTRAGSYDAIEVIGTLRYFSKRSCHRDIELQQPADVMRLFTDDWLRARGWFARGMPHANDALRHCAYRLAKAGRIRVTT